MGRGPEVRAGLATRFAVCGLAGALLVGASAAVAMPDGFMPTDDAVGPTCAYYLGMGNMPWRHPGGDWVDAGGLRQGARPFSASPVAAGRGRQTAELDLTELVRGWLDGR